MQPTRLFDFIHHQKAHYPQQVTVAGKSAGKWKTYSTDECIDMYNRVSRGLIGLGVQPGDMIGVISANRPEWNFVDNGIMQTGAICVPLYPTISASEYEYIFNHAGLKYIFVSDKAIYDRALAAKAKSPSLVEIYSFDEIAGCKNWTECLKAGEGIGQEEVEARKSAVNPAELATIIYTSGTTGNPKGVMLSHNNIISNIMTVVGLLPLHHTYDSISFLPLCHIFERVVLYVYVYTGVSTYFCDNVEQLRDYLPEVRPHFFSAVPRVIEKLYERVISNGSEQKGLKKKIFFWAVDLAGRYEIDKDQGWWYNQQLKIARKLVFSKVLDRLGGRVIGIVTGASALPAKLCKFFNATGLWMREGYGQTETSPVVSFNQFTPGGIMEGTVGPVIPGVTVKIDENNGEILVKGPNVMLGYYKNEEATAQTIDKDGWLHTGDVGMMIDNKFLKITDRIKELFKTSGGKYIAPLPLETKFKESFFIEQMMVVGEHQKFPGALIVPSFPYLMDWCKDNNIPWDNNDREKSLNHPQIQAKFKEIVNEFNKEFGNWEQIKRFELMPNDWTVDGGELTPTMKLKRRIILKNYQSFIDRIYS
ncbi:MAG: AMP-dependent synthetase/ligase [Bacteroidia bacterium]